MIVGLSENINLNKLAEGYNKKRRIPECVLTEIIKSIESYLLVKIANKIVDVGSGTGRFLLPLAERNGDVKFVGVDKVCGMVSECKKEIEKRKLTNVGLIEANLEKGIPIDEQTADGAIVYHVFHLIDDKQNLVNELKRVLRKGGRLLIASTSHKQLENTWNYKYMPKILDWEYRRTPDISSIVQMFKDSGFKVIGVKEVSIKKYFSNVDEWVNFFRVRPISILSGISDKELEDLLLEAKDKLINDFGENFSFEYSYDFHTQLYFEKL